MIGGAHCFNVLHTNNMKGISSVGDGEVCSIWIDTKHWVHWGLVITPYLFGVDYGVNGNEQVINLYSPPNTPIALPNFTVIDAAGGYVRFTVLFIYFMIMLFCADYEYWLNLISDICVHWVAMRLSDGMDICNLIFISFPLHSFWFIISLNSWGKNAHGLYHIF